MAAPDVADLAAPRPAIIEPPTPPLWRWELVAHDGTPLADLGPEATGRRLTLARNAGGDARFALPLDMAEPLRSLLVVGQVDLLVSRAGRRIWRGPVMGADVDLGETSGRVTLSAVSIWETFAHRVLPAGYEVLATEATEAAAQMVLDAQDGADPGRDLRVVPRETPASVARTRTWDTPSTYAAAVEELAALEDGFDWSITPQQADEGDGWWWDAWYPRQGNDLDLVLEWGRNVTGVSSRQDGTLVRNRVTAMTSNQVGVTAYDGTSAGLYREREQTLNAGDVDDAGVLADMAAGALTPVPRHVPRLVLAPGLVTLDDLSIGDTCEVRVRHGWLGINGRLRVEQIEVEVTDEGMERLTVIPQENPGA